MAGLGDLSEYEINLIQDSYSALGQQIPDVIADLYPTYFSRYPEYAKYFEETDFEVQRQGVKEFFKVAIPNLNEPDFLEQTVDRLARVHQEYDIPAEAYEDMGKVFLDLLEKYAGEIWDDELAGAWLKLWEGLSQALRE